MRTLYYHTHKIWLHLVNTIRTFHVVILHITSYYEHCHGGLFKKMCYL